MKLAKWRGVQPARVMSSTCSEIHVRTVVVRASFLVPETRPSGPVPCFWCKSESPGTRKSHVFSEIRTVLSVFVKLGVGAVGHSIKCLGFFTIALPDSAWLHQKRYCWRIHFMRPMSAGRAHVRV